MSTKIIVVGFALLLTTPVLAREKTDVLVMRNGDRMTCEIKGVSAGVLYVSFDYIDGTAAVDWSKLARVGKTTGWANASACARSPFRCAVSIIHPRSKPD